MGKSNIQMERQIDAMTRAQQQYNLTIKSLGAEKVALCSQMDQLHTDRGKMQKEFKKASVYIGQLEERMMDANKTSLDLLKRVRDLELETDTLKNYIIELKARVAVYVPIKDDPVDVKMAEFINNYPDRNKLKIMFMRESSGVYEFGSKKVTVRVEKNKI